MPDSRARSLVALHSAARRYCWAGEAEQWAGDLPQELAHLLPAVRDPFSFPVAWEQVIKADVSYEWGDFLVYGGAVPETDGYRECAAMLGAIRVEVERSVPEEFAAEAGLRAFLAEAGQRARPFGAAGAYRGSDGQPVKFARDPDWSPDQRAVAEQARADYLAYVAAVTIEEALAGDSMPYWRTLPDAEVERLRQACLRRWDADPTLGWWYPMRLEDPPFPPDDLLVVHSHAFVRDFGSAAVQALLRRRGIHRVWVMNQTWPYPPAAEMEVGQATFFGVETMWSSRTLDWLIYASHEESITFAGRWLVRALKAAWPRWEAARYERVLADYRQALEQWRASQPAKPTGSPAE